jgi:hypothetical protein
MTLRATTVLACCLVLLAAAPPAGAAASGPLPVRGLHVMAPMPDEMDLALRLVPALAKEGVNTLVVEIDYRFQFARRPEGSDERPRCASRPPAPRGWWPARERRSASRRAR